MRGVGEPIRYLLEYIAHPWEDVQYEQGDAPTYSMDAWTDVKDTLDLDFPNIPYLIDQDFKLTGGFAIMKYLANQYAPELTGETLEEKVQIEVLYEQIKDIKTAITGPCYTGGDRDKLIVLVKRKMKPLVGYLGNKRYMIEDKITLIDFLMFELCEFV